MKPNRWITIYTGVALGVGLVFGFTFAALGEPKVVEKRVEVEKQVEVTPAICLEALDLAAEGFGHGATGAEAASDAFTAISNFDVAGIEEATGRIEEATDLMNALTPQLSEASDACRAAA